jgi:hypothetical protein
VKFDAPHDGNKYLRRAHLAGQPIDDHRDGVAGVINEQLVATHVGLAHRNRELPSQLRYSSQKRE